MTTQSQLKPFTDKGRRSQIVKCYETLTLFSAFLSFRVESRGLSPTVVVDRLLPK